MEWIDIFLIAMSVFAIYRGYKNGVVVELAGIIGLVVGGFVAYYYNDAFINMFKLDFPFAEQVSFVAVVLIIVLLTGLAARIISRVLSGVGLGVINSLLGSVVSFFKMTLILSLLFTAFDAINRTADIVDQTSLERSKGYQPTIKLAETFFPYIDFVYDYLDGVKEKVGEGVESVTEGLKDI